MVSVALACLWILAILFLDISTRKSMNTNFRQEEKKILDRILSPKIHDSQIRPLGTASNNSDPDEGSTKVLVNFRLLFVSGGTTIDLHSMTWAEKSNT